MSIHPVSPCATRLADATDRVSTVRVERRAGFCDGVRVLIAPVAACVRGRGAAADTQIAVMAPRLIVRSTVVVVDSAALAMIELSARWLRQIGAARLAWSRLSYAELVHTDGLAEKIAALVQERYALSAEDAAKRVRHFLGKQHS